MAFFDSKLFNAEAFGKYMNAIDNEKLNKLRASRAIGRDARLRELFKNNTQTGTVYATIPYYGRIKGEGQNYDGEGDITPIRTKTYGQGVFTYGRANAWTEADFAYDVTGGADFMGNIRAQITDYFNNVDQNVLLAILEGVFKMSGTGTGNIKTGNAAFVNNHTYDITKEAAAADQVVGATSLNNAVQMASGDNKGTFSLVLMHSRVATNLENLQVLEYFKANDANGMSRQVTLATWNGRLVVIDDEMPTENVTGSDAYTKYTTYILGDNAILLEDVGAKVPYEMYRDPKTNGGEDSLFVRRRNAVAVNGITYLKASQATNSPTNAELKNGLNWSLINDGTDPIANKLVPIARIISRG